MRCVLEVTGLSAGYGPIRAIHGIDFHLAAGEAVALIGANGAGKTTFLRTVSGLMRASAGAVRFNGRDVTAMSAHALAQAGMAHVPEGRKLFRPMEVEANLELGSYCRKDRTAASTRQDIERMYALFPRLRERRRQVSGTLSGGEQQMVAVARALMGRPRLLLLDEPSLGLAPQVFLEIFSILDQVRAEGVSLLVVEQNVQLALDHSNRAYVFQTGRVFLTGPSKDIGRNAQVQEAYLGGALARAPEDVEG